MVVSHSRILLSNDLMLNVYVINLNCNNLPSKYGSLTLNHTVVKDVVWEDVE